MSDLSELNGLTDEAARAAFLRCCGSRSWAGHMAARRPFTGVHDLFAAAEAVWQSLEPPDQLEAFSAHPKIGDFDALKNKFATTGAWSAAEQSGMATAPEAVLRALAARNAEYEAKFGYIFIVCATGKSAAEMLALIEERIANQPEAEFLISAGEQAKITRIRLRKLCAMSPITTHVLDTSKGRPAAGVGVVVDRREDGGRWVELGRGATDNSGRITNLLHADVALRAGEYRLTFDILSYFTAARERVFYPEIQVVFRIDQPHEHYHIPLLLSPYGYSTYRGS
jgi:5-hydroxyisourate hydrolase/2-oxo-4-hydroxy-4-carboxy-5-ureidoimidazoline decarboxylase